MITLYGARKWIHARAIANARLVSTNPGAPPQEKSWIPHCLMTLENTYISKDSNEKLSIT